MSTTSERRSPSARSTTRPGYARITIEVPSAVKERLDRLAVELSDPMRDPVSTSGLIRMAVQALLDKHGQSDGASSHAVVVQPAATPLPARPVYTAKNLPPPDLGPDEIELLTPEVKTLYGITELRRWNAEDREANPRAEDRVSPFEWCAKLNALGFLNRQGGKWMAVDVKNEL